MITTNRSSSTTKVVPFTAHANLITDAIMRQAGKVSKAFLEAVMNAIDAGAIFVRIKVDSRGFIILDNGRGFASERHITECFAQFGAPHQKDAKGRVTDAVFAEFRIGRGQIFAHASTVWRSGKFSMDVDIKQRGLNFSLDKLPRAYAGCEITGVFYKSLEAWDFSVLIREVSAGVKYAGIEVVVNDVVVNNLPTAQTDWTHETALAYYKFEPDSGSNGLELYNLGIQVHQYYSSYSFPIRCVVVSKQNMQLNTARNEPMSDCEIWLKIKKEYETFSLEVAAAMHKCDDHHRGLLFSALARDQSTALTKSVFEKTGRKLPWLVDISGEELTVNILSRRAASSEWDKTPNGALRVAFAEKASVVTDLIHQRKKGIVLNASYWRWAKLDSGREFVEKVLMKLCRRKLMWISLEDLSKDETADNKRLVASHELTTREAVLLNILESVGSYHLLIFFRQFFNKLVPQRAIKLGEIHSGPSDDGWTDGSTYIAINRAWLRKQGDVSYDLLHDLFSLVAHEYCHLAEVPETMRHEREFYHAFHEAQQLRNKVVNAWIAAYKARVTRPSKALSKKMDLLKKLNETRFS